MKNYLNQKGFSILEVMLAFGVITIGLLGVLSLALQNAQVQSISKNYLVASMLAQEGLELVRNVRDTNFIRADQGYDWEYGQGANSATDIVQDGSYAIDYNLAVDNIPDDFTNDRTRLYLNGGRYTHQAGAGSSNTPYRRLILVTDYNPNYVEVQTIVSWTERGRTHNYEAVTNLYNWW